MSIKKTMPSTLIKGLALASLDHLSRLAHPKLAGFLATGKGPLKLANPLPVWSLGLDQVVGKDGLSDATQVAWQFFVLSGKKPIAATEVALSPSDGQPHWSHISYDPRVATYFGAIRRAFSSRKFRQGFFAMRLLRIPALDQNSLLWMKAISKGEDVIIPMASVPVLRPGWPYPVARLFDRITSHAVRRLAVSTRPPSKPRRAMGGKKNTTSTASKRTKRHTLPA
jgi:hypothetical protein